MEMDNQLAFQNNQKYRCCGAVLFTTFGRIALQCGLCDKIFSDFEFYFSHLNDDHFMSSMYLDSETDDKEPADHHRNDEEQQERCCDLTEIENLTNNDVNGEESSVSIGQSMDGADKSKTEGSDLFMMNSLKLPKKIRDMKKRQYRLLNATPGEERKFKCPICQQAFKAKSNFYQHFKRHTLERSHQCPECKNSFYTPAEVRLHMKLHTQERNFLCSDCGKTFLRKSDLANHVKIHKNQRDFKCPHCDKAFYRSSQLSYHVKGHSSLRPYVCEICPAATFSRREGLKDHMKLHENKREYQCKICSEAFNQRSGLFSHMKATHRK